MQLTRAADYALRAMVHLAALPPGTRVSRKDLAAGVECPEQFLSKVLQSLTRARLVLSHRGNAGGVELPEAGRRASILEVLEAVEGRMRLNVCLMGDRACPQQEGCLERAVWMEAQTATSAVLSRYTVAEMAGRICAARVGGE